MILQTFFPDPSRSKEEDADFSRCIDMGKFIKNDISEQDELIMDSDIRVPDIIVTLLYKHISVFLEAFLDLQSTNIKYRWEESPGRYYFSIMKQGPEIEETCVWFLAYEK